MAAIAKKPKKPTRKPSKKELASHKEPKPAFASNDPSYADHWEIAADVADIFKPPTRIKVSEAAKRFLRIKLPSGSYGPWDQDLTPYMIQPMDTLTSRDYESVCFVGPARTGKTLLIDAWTAYTIMCDPSDMAIFHTAQELAKDYSRRRVDRFIRHSPELLKRLSTKGSHDNTFDKTFKAGNILNIGWPTIRQLSSRDIKFVASTDYDRRPNDDVDGEGDLFTLMQKRTQTFGSSGMAYVESSPGFEIKEPKWKPEADSHAAPPCDGIMSIYNMGNRHLWHWQCPDCNDYFKPVMENLHYQDLKDPVDASKSAMMQCPHCASLIGPEKKRELNIAGKWVPEGQKLDKEGNLTGVARRSKIASFWMEGPAAAFQTWESLALKKILAEREFESTGSEDKLKSTVTLDQGRPYLSKSRESDRDPYILMDRSREMGKRTVPVGVRYLTGQVDVQKNRFVVQVIGWGVNGESWLVDRFNIRYLDEDKKQLVSPSSHIEHWDILKEKVINRSYPLGDESGREMKILMTACDSGGYADSSGSVTERAYQFWRECRKEGLSKKFILVKGSSRPSGQLVQKTFPGEKERKDRKVSANGDIPLHLINTLHYKDSIASLLNKEDEGSGYMHFPNWLGTWFFEELTVEYRTDKGWVCPPKARNEAFDLYVYGWAINYLKKTHDINWEYPPSWAEHWDSNANVFNPESPQEEVKKPSAKRARRTRFK